MSTSRLLVVKSPAAVARRQEEDGGYGGECREVSVSVIIIDGT